MAAEVCMKIWEILCKAFANLHTIFTDSALILCAVLDIELRDQKWPSCPICQYDFAQQTILCDNITEFC